MRNTWDITNLRGVQKKGFPVTTAARLWIIRNKKREHQLMTQCSGWTKGFEKFWFFEKWQMLKFKVVYSTKISLTFLAFKKKNNRQKKNPSSIRRTIIYKISEENLKLIGQVVLKLQWSPTSKTWFREERV